MSFDSVPVRIPDEWSAAWFRQFYVEVLSKGDSRNVIGDGLVVTVVGNQKPTYTVSAAPAIDSHNVDPFAHLGAFAAHRAEADPHAQYLTQAELDAQMAVQYATQYDQDADPPTVAYLGQAVPGTATSSAGWRIQKLTFGGDGDVSTQWADGDALFNNVWDNRASLSYS